MLVFLWAQTERGGDVERVRQWPGTKKEEENRRQSEFHGARPLGASGPSSVSGPRHSGQLSSGSGWIGFRTTVFSLLAAAESSGLALCSRCRWVGLSRP